MSEAEVTLLGGFHLAVGGREVALPATSQRLVALLALRGPSGRSRLAGTLWPDSSEERALASLRTVMWRLNHGTPHVVVAAGSQVCLGPALGVDLQLFVHAAARMLRDPAGCEDWEELIDVDGELLPEWGDEWLVAHRERLRQLQLHVLETAAQQLTRLGRHGLALEAALAAVRADPLRESAHRAVIGVHVAEGNVVEARRAYAACRHLLQRELGVEPSPLTLRALACDGALQVPAPTVR